MTRPNEHESWQQLLGQAWDEHTPGEATPELTRSDAATRATVDWLAAAWEAHPAPAVEPPEALRRAALGRARARRPRLAPILRVRTWQRHAAAAVLLLGLAAVLQLGALRHFGVQPPLDAPGPGVTPRDPVPAPRADPRLVAVAADHIEMRSGPVRLMLFTNTDSPSLTDDSSTGDDSR